MTLSPWPTTPAEIRAAVAMLAGMAGLRPTGSPSKNCAIDQGLAVAVLLAPTSAVPMLIAMRESVHAAPPIDTPPSDERFRAWVDGWWSYRHVCGLLDGVVVARHAELDDCGYERWREGAS